MSSSRYPRIDFERLLDVEAVLDEQLEAKRASGIDVMAWSDYERDQADLHATCGYTWNDYEAALHDRWSRLDALRASPLQRQFVS